MGIIITTKYTEGNVFLQFPGKMDVMEWLPILLVKQGIEEKLFLADGKGGGSLVVDEEQLPGLLDFIGREFQPKIQKVDLVEISGYRLRTDAATLPAIYKVLENVEIDVFVLSASDTELTVVVPNGKGQLCLQVLEKHFSGSIE